MDPNIVLDIILRDNYGRWLQIMGLDVVGLRLRLGIAKNSFPKIPFSIRNIAGTNFAFLDYENYIKKLYRLNYAQIFDNGCLYNCIRYRSIISNIKVGIRYDILKRIFSTLREGYKLTQVKPLSPEDVMDNTNEQLAYFSDGAIGILSEEFDKYKEVEVVWL